MLNSPINKNDHFSGNANARVTLLIYEDFECEYCEKAYHEVKRLRECFKEKICIIYRNFPFICMHPSALLAALIVEACSLQNKFIQAHDLLFECQEYLEYGLGGVLHLLEKNYSVSLEQLSEDLKKENVKRKINKDMESGTIRHITNTPAIFINGCSYKGSVKFDKISKVIEDIISKGT